MPFLSKVLPSVHAVSLAPETGTLAGSLRPQITGRKQASRNLGRLSRPGDGFGGDLQIHDVLVPVLADRLARHRLQIMPTGEQTFGHYDRVTSIHLRPLGESDLPVLERLTVDPLTAGAFDWHGFKDPGARRRRLAEDGFLGRDPRNLAVAFDHDDSCIGDVSWFAVPTGPTSTCWNMGIVLLPEFRGKGYGTAAQRLLADYLFATTTANRVEAETDVENLAEQRALEKAGFICEGIRRGSQFRDGRWRDMAVYGRLRNDPAPEG